LPAPIFEPQRRQERKGHPPTQRKKPQITQINADGFKQASSTWRGPSRRRTTAGNRWTGPSLRTHAFVTVARSSSLRSAERSPRHFSSLRVRWKMPPFQTGEGRGGTDAPSARRPGGSTAATNVYVRSRRTSHRWSAIVRLPTVPPSILGTASLGQRQPLCVLCVFAVKNRTGGRCRLGRQAE
jgi:hypothetical protein